MRNHNSVPDIKKEEWTLEIEENKAVGIPKTVSFTLDDLKDPKKFKRREVVAALQCAGNR